MTLQEAHNLLQRAKNETGSKSEIKVYDKFLHILSGLSNREFSKDEMQSLETELDSLNLESNPENRKKQLKKALYKLEKYVRVTFSLISKGYYTNVGLSMGASFGLLLGIVALSGFERSLGISLGLSFGALIGLIIGRHMDSRAMEESKVL